jgi:hypothetical protein
MFATITTTYFQQLTFLQPAPLRSILIQSLNQWQALLTISDPQISQSQMYAYFLFPNLLYVSASPTFKAAAQRHKPNDDYLTVPVHTAQILESTMK